MRAEILDLQKIPAIDFDINLISDTEPNNTFIPGLHYWAVSALYPDTGARSFVCWNRNREILIIHLN